MGHTNRRGGSGLILAVAFLAILLVLAVSFSRMAREAGVHSMCLKVRTFPMESSFRKAFFTASVILERSCTTRR